MAMKASDYIGGYQLVEPIAEGGMGTIWKATSAPR